jgi:regulator of protease activity HflC (stomatin/prohibitin superfamily)
MKIDTVVFFQITDPKLFVYGVERPMSAIENLTATTLRNIVGDLELDETLTSRDLINTKMRSILDEATDPWGIKVNRVELKNIMPPAEIQDAMEKQMKAERQRRESILTAEGQKKSAILVAEGEKQSAILVAEAKKEAAIREAEGQAEAILKVQSATAEGIKMLNASTPTEKVLALKSFEALVNVANGQATKLIIPSEIQNMAGLAASLKEMIKD